MKTEDLSYKILQVLKEDARILPKKLASMLNAEESEIKNLIEKMEQEGIIVKYTTIINAEKMDVERVEAMIEVKVSPMHTKGFDSIAEDIYRLDEVKSVYLMSGAYDLAVFIEGRTLKEVASFVSEKLSSMDKILSTATHFILKRYKGEGVIFENSNVSRRLVVQP